MLQFISQEIWHQTRLLLYIQSGSKQPVWDFMPLKGDPTAEEREKIIAESKEKGREMTDAAARNLLQEYKLAKKAKRDA